MSLALTCQLFVDGTWQVYAAYADDGWEVQIGPDVETGTRPNRLAFTLANNNLAMDPSRVTSSLYGKIGRNTRARIQLGGVTLTQAEASSWQPDATVDHVAAGTRGKSWVALAGEGLLRRLGRWTDPVRSAIARQILSYPSVTGYWTLEDPSGAVQLSQEVPLANVGVLSGSVTLGGDPGPGGSDSTAEIGADGVLKGSFLTPAGDGYQITWAAKMVVTPGSASYNTIMAWTDTARRQWAWQVNNANHQISVSDFAGTLIDSIAFSYGTTYQPTQWIRYRVKVTVSGSVVTYEPAIYIQDATTPAGVTRTFASTGAGRAATWAASGNSYTDGASYGHVMAVTDTTLDLIGSGDARNSFNGYLGETTSSRFYRLTGEEGLTRYVSGTGAFCVRMGRQKPGIFLDLLEECVRTEGGMLYDEPLDVALTFVTNRGLVNLTPALTLTKAQVVAPLRKTIDDVGVVNDVTVKNAEGSTARVTLEVGSLSAAVPPAGVGRVKGTVDVNMSDVSQLANRANWELRKGTLDRPRYLQVTVSLLANPGLTAAVNALRPGAWITLSGVEPDTITLRVVSFLRSGGAVEDTVTLNCLPAELYNVAVFAAATSRWDSGSTTLAAAIATTGATAVSLTTATYQDRWSSAGVPYDIMIMGERMTVTAMTVAAGTGPWTQTATVTRAVNGVAKTHATTAPDGSAVQVHLFAPVRYTLT